MKTSVTMIFFLMNLTVTGQEAQKNVLGTSPFRVELNSETVHNGFEPKIITGLFYERVISKWSWTAAFEYGQNTIYDYCRNCADAQTGKGLFTEFNTYLGLKYTFNPFSESRLKYFAELCAYYSHLNYSGVFSGGWSGSTMFIDRKYNVVGGLLSAGINYFPRPGIVISISTSMRLGRMWSTGWPALPKKYTVSGAVVAPQIGIGFLF